MTPEDIIFSWELLRDRGRPNFRTYYIKATKAEQRAIGQSDLISPAPMIANFRSSSG